MAGQYIRITCLLLILVASVSADNHGVKVFFNKTDLKVLENAGSLTVYPQRSGDINRITRVNLTALNDTAFSGIDFNATSVTLTFAENVTFLSHSVGIINDQVLENNETFILVMETTELNVNISSDKVNVTIIDEDKVTVGFSNSSLSVEESAGYVKVCMTKEGEAAISVRVSLTTANGTAHSSEDYVAITRTEVIFTANEHYKCINVTIKDDNITEGNEKFNINLETSDPNVLLKQNKTALTIDIISEDKATIGFSTSSLSVPEGDGYAKVCIAKESQASIPLNVNVFTANGTAKSPEDYTSISGLQVTFAPNETEKCVNVSIKDDNILESNKTFYVSLMTDDSNVILKENRKNASVVITNDDQVTVQFNEKSYTVNESVSSFNVVVTMNGTTEIDVVVSLAVINKTAHSGHDFTGILSSQMLTFGPTLSMQTSKNVSINIIDDMLVEGREDMELKLSSNNRYIVIGPNNPAVVSIQDNDKVTIGFSNSSLSVEEPVGSVKVCMTKEGEAAISVNVSLTTANDTAHSSEDYVALMRYEVIFTANEHYKCENVTIKDDSITESDEKFYIKLETSDPHVLLKQNKTRLAIDIISEDKATIGFYSSSLSVPEGDGYAKVCIVKESQASIPLDVNVSTADGTAKAPKDYTSISELPVTFAPNEMEKCVNVSIEGENILELNETFYVSLTTNDSDVILNPNRRNLSVVITNDDQVTVEFNKALYELKENASTLTVEVTMNGTTEIDVVVSLAVINMTAHYGHDFTGSQKLTFSPTLSTLTTKNVTVKIAEDIIVEGNEYLILILLSMNRYIVIGRQNTTSVHILDNDKVTIGFSNSSLSVEEAVGYLTFCMTKEGEAAIPVNIALTTANGTAHSSEDYVAITRTEVIFTANEHYKCMNVTIKDDNITESNETFYINLETSDHHVLLKQNKTRLTVIIINDDKVTVQFRTKYMEVVEENLPERAVKFYCVIIEGMSKIPVSISFVVDPDNFTTTAEEGKDFTLNKYLTFQPGNTSIPLIINIEQDKKAESTETIAVQMTSPDESLVTIGENNIAKVKINDTFDNEQAEKQKEEDKKQREKEDDKIFTLLVATIVIVSVVLVCGVVVVVCLCIVK